MAVNGCAAQPSEQTERYSAVYYQQVPLRINKTVSEDTHSRAVSLAANDRLLTLEGNMPTRREKSAHSWSLAHIW
jgi:hypothetical protein